MHKSIIVSFFLLLLNVMKVNATPLFPYPEDPLGTHKGQSHSPGLAAGRSGGDPCLSLRSKTEKWGLVDVIEQSLCHNPRTRQAWANAKQQASQLGIAESNYLPSFNFIAPISRSKNSVGGGIETNVPVQGSGDGRIENTRLAPTLSLNYLLLDFGGRAAKFESARHSLEAANWTHASVIQAVLFSAIQAYYQHFAAMASLEAAQATEKSTLRALESATFRYEIGTVSLADKLQAQTTHNQAKVNAKTAVGNLKTTLGALATIMGLKPNDNLQFESPDLQGPDPEREKDVQLLMDLAKDSRPDLAAAESKVKATEADILVAESGAMPTLSLVGNYTYLATVGEYAIPSWAVGVQISMPLFTGFSDTYKIKSAQERAEEQAAMRDQLEQSVAQDVWKSYYVLATTRDNLKNTQEWLDSALEAEKVALSRYEEGIGTIVELLNAETNLANSRYQYVHAHYNWRIGKAQLAQALGQLQAEDFSTLR